jgi:sigma-B regulation protein RsbU (phosphoserine phosphatase)
MSAGYAVESSSAPGDPTVGYSTAALEKDARESLLRLARDTDPVTSLREANRSIFLDSKTSMFVTLFYAILDPQKRRLTFVNAGHNPPLLFSSGSPGVSLLNANGIAPGMIDEVDREPVEVTLSPGDVVVLYTDGVTEAANEHDEEYGIGRLSALVEASKGLPAKEIISAIVQDVRRFTGKRPQSDDITLMVLKVT